MLQFIKKGSGLKDLFKCECGNEKWINRGNVKSGKQVSCGCYGIKAKRQAQINKALSRRTIKHNDFIELELTNGEYTKLDYEDYEKIKEYCWYKSIRGSVESRINHKLTKLHRIIINAKDGKVVDHINGDPLDNRKYNLRICSQHENSLNQKKPINNKTGIKGCYFCKTRKKFVVQIIYKGKKTWGGQFDNIEDAKKASNNLLKKIHGEYARLN